MAGDGGLDGWRADSLVGGRDYEIRISLFIFLMFFLWFCL